MNVPSLLLAMACGSGPPTPDLVVVGRLHAGPGDGWEERAVLVEDGRITGVVAVEEAERLGGTRLVADRVTAGFVDAHAHPIGLGRKLAELDLTGATTYAETLDRVRAAAEGEGWLVGRGWDQNDWSDAPEGGWPRAADLDAIVPDRPVALRRVDGHATWVNTAALRAAGIGEETPDPPGGRILRQDGVAVGVLVDAAADGLAIPDVPEAEARRRLEEALGALVGVGLTGVHDMGVDDGTLAAYEALRTEGRLPLRVRAYVTPDSAAAARVLADGPWGDERLRVVGIKVAADGALGSRGALLSADYSDEPGHAGLAVTSAEALADLSRRSRASGVQLAVHAIGDLGVRNALDAWEAAGPSEVRLRVEHAQVVHPGDLPRFATLDAVASMQPTHATSDMPWAEARLGPDRVRWAYAWRSFLEAGVPLAFGSDLPVEGHDPALGLWASVTRTDPDGSPAGGWLPEQALSLEETVDAFTRGAAWAVHEEEHVGTVAAGRWADLTLWREVEREGQATLQAVATVVDGEVVWREQTEAGSGGR